MIKQTLRLVGWFLVALAFVTQPARAEQQQVRIVMPYGLGYLPTYIAVDRGLIEKHAKAAGLDDIKVTLQHMASGPASSDLLLAGDADLAMGGFGPAFVLWDKTRGARQGSHRDAAVQFADLGADE